MGNKVFVCTSFTGHWPVGVAAVVCAEDEPSACAMLNEQLLNRGLPADAKPEGMLLIPVSERAAYILNDGDY